MLRRNVFSALIAVSLLFPCACLLAQTVPSTPAHHEMPKPTNLQVLPRDIAPQDLITMMRQFSGALGVHCTFCHAENNDTHRPDFASDAKPEKGAARVMIQMTRDLNAKYLTQLPDHGVMAKVSCGTCHRGAAMPSEFIPVPEEQRPPSPPSK